MLMKNFLIISILILSMGVLFVLANKPCIAGHCDEEVSCTNSDVCGLNCVCVKEDLNSNVGFCTYTGRAESLKNVGWVILE